MVTVLIEILIVLLGLGNRQKNQKQSGSSWHTLIEIACGSLPEYTC